MQFQRDQRQIFSIRKFKAYGATSVLLGLMILGVNDKALAEQIAKVQVSPESGEATQATSPTTSATLETDNLVIAQATGSAVVVKENDAHRLEPVRQKALKDLEALKGDLDHESYVSYSNQIKSATDIDVFASIIKRAKANADEQKAVKLANPAKKATVADEDTSNLSYKERLESTRAKVLSQLYALKGDLSADAYASYQRQLTNTTDVALLDRILERAQKSLVQSDASQPQKAEATVASDSTNRQSLLNESTVSESTELIDLLDKAEDKQAAVRLFFETQLNFDKAKALELFNLVNVDYNTATSKEVHEAIVLAMAEMKNKPQSRVRRARAAGSESDLALTPTVKFIDLRDGSELTPEKVLDGQYGDDIRVNAEVTFPSSATDKQVTFNFAPFVKVKAHSVVDLEQLKEPGKVQVNKEPLAAANGKQYHLLTTLEPAKPGLAEVIYKFKDNVLKTTVSFTMEVEPGAFVTGYAKNGSVSGVTKGIEKSPLVVANIENIAQGEKKTSQNEVHQTSILLKGFQKSSVAPNGAQLTHVSDTRAASISEQRYTNLNDYTAKTTFHYGTLLEEGETIGENSNSYFDDISFEVVLPQGVTLLRVETGSPYQKDVYPETAFQMVPQPQSDGTTLVKVSTKNPIMVDRYSKLYLVTKFDPDQKGKVVGEEETVSLVIQKPKLTLRNYSPEDNLLQQQSPYRTLNLKIERNRPEGENVISRGLYYIASRDGVTDYNRLISLGALPHDPAFLNDSDVDSVEKVIELEPTAHVVLKGFLSTFLDVTGQSKSETFNIEVKTKETGAWKTHAVKRQTYYDVVSLGYSQEDIITGIRRDVGVIKAGEGIVSGSGSRAYSDPFIGRFAETAPKDRVVETIKLTLSDKAPVRPDTPGYSESPEELPHYHAPVSTTIGVDVREHNKLDSVYTTVEVNKREIKQGETARINYTVGNERYLSDWRGTLNVKKIRSISLVLPKTDIGLPTSAIRLRNEKGQYFVASSAERDLPDGQRLYTFNLDNVTDDNNIVGREYVLGEQPNIKRILVEVDVENKRLKDDYLLQLNRSIFVQTEDATPNVRRGTVRGEDPYNIYNDLENDHNVFTNLTTDLAVNLKVVDKLLATTKAKTTGSDFDLVNAKNALNISDTSQSATVRVDLTNNQEVDAGQVVFYIPVPKRGQNWGTSLQDKAFDYTLHLSKAVSSTYPEFTTKFDVDYATVEPAQLTGAINYSHDRLSRLSYSKPSDLTNVNLIRVKAKSDQLFPKKTTVDLNFDYTVNQGTVTDGKENGFRGLYYSDMGSYAGVSETPTVNINITLGAKKLQVFNDANDDDQKQPTERSLEAKIKVVDTENQLSYDLTSLSNDALLISKLVSGRKYNVTIENPDSNTYRFVEGVKGATNVKFTKERVTFDMIPDVNDGLKNIETITVPMTTQKTTYTFKKVDGLAQNKNSIGFFNDNVTPPSPTPGIGMTFAGWKDDASSEVASSKGIQALTYGTSPKSYTGLFAEHKETVTANLVWQNGPEAHPEVQLELVKLHNGTQTVVNTQTLTNGTNSYTWRDLPVAENGTAVTYLVRQKGDLENYRESLRSGNRVTKAVASEAELLKQVQRTKANVSVNVADTSHTLTLAYVSPKKTYNTTVNVTGGPGIATFPKTITLTLKRGNNETVATKQVTITGTSTLQQVDFGSHDINDATGNAYTYTVDSTGLEHYRLTKEGQGLTALKFTYSRTQAQDTRLNNPREKVLVENPNALSSTEIQQVKNAIMETNEDLAPRQITIAANGEATIMFSDKSSKTMAPEVTVVQKESAKYVPQKPAKAILVRNLSQLTQEEQEQVKAAVQTQNRDNLPDSAGVSVDAQGKVTITYVDQTKDFIQASETVKL
ncbi:Cna B-type domain-containing protein, partial [Streptococcus pluranimalium]|uniref:Cna B-type domain-containing protein n=1 Tax=Streptococcus pluranimalium TaxID=82348 RepID=UPI0039FB8BBD